MTLRQNSSLPVFLFSLVVAAGFVALVVGSGKSHSLQSMAAHTQLVDDKAVVSTSAPEPAIKALPIRLLDERSFAGYATDALLRPGLEIEDGTAFLNYDEANADEPRMFAH